MVGSPGGRNRQPKGDAAARAQHLLVAPSPCAFMPVLKSFGGAFDHVRHDVGRTQLWPVGAEPAGSRAAAAPGDDPVVAVVDGAELRRAIEALARSLPEQYRQVPLPQIYGMLLDRAIDFRLLANAAEGQDLAEDPEVQTALAQARAGVLRDAYVSSRSRSRRPRTSCARATRR